MSWFSDAFKKAKKRFSFDKIGKGFFSSGGYVLPGVGELVTGSGKVENVFNQVGEGLGNLVTGGYIGQKKATEQAQQAADDAKKRYAKEQAAAEETARKIAEAEEERKRRLAAMGTQTPSTLYGTYLGLSSAKRSMLG